jgi:hypothetical protein
MRHRIAGLAVVAGGVGLGALSSAPVLAARSASCHPASATVLASGRLARVFSLHGSVYGCAERSGRRTLLGSSNTCLRRSLAGPAAAVSGPLAAYSLEMCGVDTGYTSVVVRNLATGAQLYDAPASTVGVGPEAYTTVNSIVLASDGACAWIASSSSLGTHRTSRELDRASARAHVRLDSGGAIVADSLRLHGSRLTWRHGTVPRSAKLR